MAEEPDLIDGDFQTVFGSAEGERVLRYLMSSYFVFEGTLEAGPNKTVWNEGQRSVVLDILEKIRRKPSPIEFSQDVTQSMLDYKRQQATDSR